MSSTYSENNRIGISVPILSDGTVYLCKTLYVNENVSASDSRQSQSDLRNFLQRMATAGPVSTEGANSTSKCQHWREKINHRSGLYLHMQKQWLI